jgi:phosphatidylglycerol---prolipoprotein diacylglyceryl transferase
VMYAIAPMVGIPRVAASIATLIMFVPALAGSRVWFVLDHWSTYRHDLRSIWRHADGGMTMYGGLVLALVVSPLVLKPLGLRFTPYWDAAMFTTLVGMIFARVGCLLNGCCAGRHSDGRLGLYLPDHSGQWERRYPVQLLELGAALLLLAGCATLLMVGTPRGTIFVFGLVGYATLQFAIDPLRERPTRSSAGRPVALATFLALSVLAAGVGWFATA